MQAPSWGTVVNWKSFDGKLYHLFAEADVCMSHWDNQIVEVIWFLQVFYCTRGWKKFWNICCGVLSATSPHQALTVEIIKNPRNPHRARAFLAEQHSIEQISSKYFYHIYHQSDNWPWVLQHPNGPQPIPQNSLFYDWVASDSFLHLLGQGYVINSRPNMFKIWKCISNILSETSELL